MNTAPIALALCIVFPILSLLAVAARFYARKLQKAGYQADDWVILPALLFSIGNAIAVLYGAINADLGQHTPRNSAGKPMRGHKLISLQKTTYASEPIATTALTLARFSILLFYARIFTSRSFRTPVYLMYALNLSWGISFTIAYLAQCSPISDFWSKPIDHRHCINISIHEYFAISSIILDVLILCMPWPMVWRLQMALKHKVAVLSIFMLGAIIIATSIGKCVTFFSVSRLGAHNRDPTYNNAPLFYWTVPECSLSVVCACLPTLRPIFRGFSPESLISSIRNALSLRSKRSALSNESTDYCAAESKNTRLHRYPSHKRPDGSAGDDSMAQLARRSEEQGIQNLQDLQPGASLVSSVESGGQELENGGTDVEKGSMGIRAQ